MAKAHSNHVLDLARRGAEARLRDMETEKEYLLGLFPELRSGLKEAAPIVAAPQVRRRKMGRSVSPEMRKAISLRMKKYWAERRKARK